MRVDQVGVNLQHWMRLLDGVETDDAHTIIQRKVIVALRDGVFRVIYESLCQDRLGSGRHDDGMR